MRRLEEIETALKRSIHDSTRAISSDCLELISTLKRIVGTSRPSTSLCGMVAHMRELLYISDAKLGKFIDDRPSIVPKHILGELNCQSPAYCV
jgi:hypothetical protein